MESQLNYDYTPEFQKDFKRLLKKFRSLEEDFELAKVAAIELFHLRKLNNLSVVPIKDVCTDKVLICKVKKFACKALKGRGAKSGIRVIYAFHSESCRVDFIELYFNHKRVSLEELYEEAKSKAHGIRPPISA